MRKTNRIVLFVVGRPSAGLRRTFGSDLLVWIVLALLALVFALPTAQAQEPLTVESNKTLEILSSPNPVTNAAAEKGFVKVNESSTTPNLFLLLYHAPKVDADMLDTVTYTVGGVENEIQVKVTIGTQPPTLMSNEIYVDSFTALFVLFIIAVVLESGLSVIFNWRPYIEFFDSRGVKTIIMLTFAFLFVEIFDLDIATRLVNVYAGSQHPVNFPGKLVTALVLAGGSSGVNNLMVAFGFRSLKRKQQVEPTPKPDEAWIAIRLMRDKSVGSVYVLIGQQGSSPTIAGTITGTSKGNRGLRYFLRDKGRFPTAGGYPVKPEIDSIVRLEGVDDTGAKLTSPDWGPYSFAKRAIIDLDLAL